jgi:hypothetical protein
MRRGIFVFLVCGLLIFSIFFAGAQEEGVEGLPPEPTEEEIPAFGVEKEVEEALPAEAVEEKAPSAEAEVKPAEPSEAPAEKLEVKEPRKEAEESLPGKRVLPEEAIPEGMELVLKAYDVKTGDCLWDIANQCYRNPFLWREIWRYNQYIKDPHWIFPGDDLIIPTYQSAEASKEAPREPGVKLEELKPGTEYERDIFIAPPDFEFDGCIAGVKEKKLMTAYGDTVFIDLGKSQQVEPKTRYSIYRQGEEVIHPTTGEVMGIMVEKIGVLEVTSDIEEGSSTAVIVDSRKPVEIGDSIKMQLKPKERKTEE